MGRGLDWFCAVWDWQRTCNSKKGVKTQAAFLALLKRKWVR